MLYLRLRPGEAAGLSWIDIDVTNGMIHIWRARTTNTDGSVTIGATKTPDPKAGRNEFDRLITTARGHDRLVGTAIGLCS